MADVNLVAVEMECQGIVKGDDWQSRTVHCRCLHAEHLDKVINGKAFAHIIMGDNDSAGLTHVHVTAGMVRVPVGVEQKADWLVRERGNRRFYFFCQGRELVINQKNTVCTDR